MPSLFKFRTVVTTLVLLALGYVALWYTVGFRTQKAVTATLAEWLDRGLAVRHGQVKLSGFPYRFVIEVDDLEVATRKDGLSIESDRMTLVSHLWTPDHWVVQSAGNTVVLAGGAVRFFEEFLQASYRLHDGDKLVIKIDSSGAADQRITSPEGLPALTQWSLLLGKDYSDEASASGLYEKRTLEFRFFAENNSGSLEFTGGVSGPELADWSVTELAEWRDEGGLVELDSMTWQSGPMQMEASGDVTLDEAFRPLGSANLSSTDWNRARQMLAPYGFRVGANLPTETALMMQNGAALIDGEMVLPLPRVIGRQ